MCIQSFCLLLFERMAICVHCGADTLLHVGGQPVCPCCADLVAMGKRPLPRAPKVQTVSQTRLLDLIMADIDLGFSLVEAAKSAANPEQVRSNVQGAERALNSVRLFSGRIRDTETWKRIHGRTNELEIAIRSLPR